jgi:Phage capsid-like protein
MPSVTLAEAAKLAENDLVRAVIQQIIVINRMFDVLPFDSLDGNSIEYNRENVLGDVINAGHGTTFSFAASGKAPATFTQVNASLTTIMGDAEVNGLIQATRSGDGIDQAAAQIASKAKSVSRQYQQQLITGTGASNQFAGLSTLCSATQRLATGINGGPMTFALLDELLHQVTDKNGAADYLTMPSRTLRSYRALLRALGGAKVSEVVDMPGGAQVPAYGGVPIFKNDYIPINQTKGSSSGICTTIFAGTFDDGTRSHGIAGLTAAEAAGIQVEEVGEKEDADEGIWRVKWYCGLALFNEQGLALADGVTN